MEGYRKIIAMVLPMVVGLLNTIPVLPQIELPKDYTWETLIVWVIGVLVLYIPTIIALIAGTYYTKKNVEEATAFAASNAVIIGKPMAPVISSAIVTPATPIVVTPTTEVSLVKDRIASSVKLINKDTKWDFLLGIWVDKIEAAKADLLRHNPNMTQEDVNELLAKYANGVLNEEDCKNVQSVMGLPGVLHAKNDVLILQSMQTAEKAGTLSKSQSDAYLKSAIRGVTMDILNEAVMRVQNDSLPIELRRLALQEFGLSKSSADRAMFSGGQCQVIINGGFTHFDQYALTGVNPFS